MACCTSQMHQSWTHSRSLLFLSIHLDLGFLPPPLSATLYPALALGLAEVLLCSCICLLPLLLVLLLLLLLLALSFFLPTQLVARYTTSCTCTALFPSEHLSALLPFSLALSSTRLRSYLTHTTTITLEPHPARPGILLLGLQQLGTFDASFSTTLLHSQRPPSPSPRLAWPRLRLALHRNLPVPAAHQQICA